MRGGLNEKLEPTEFRHVITAQQRNENTTKILGKPTADPISYVLLANICQCARAADLPPAGSANCASPQLDQSSISE